VRAGILLYEKMAGVRPNYTGVIAVTADFGESDNCGSSLASAASCIINLTFTPPAVGTVTGTLSITDNASGSPQTVSLSGTGSLDSFTGYCLVIIAGNQCQPLERLPPLARPVSQHNPQEGYRALTVAATG
jgi:hypothetical protein